MSSYPNKEYFNSEGPYWLFFRDDVIRLCKEAGVDTDHVAYQIVFYLNDWFWHLDHESKNVESSENFRKYAPMVIEGLMKIIQHDYTGKAESFKLKNKLDDVKEKVGELSEMLKDD